MGKYLVVTCCAVLATGCATSPAPTGSLTTEARAMREACVELRRALFQDSIVRSYTVYARCDNGRVVLNGTVPDFAARQQAEMLALETPGVRRVQNNLRVSDPDDVVRY